MRALYFIFFSILLCFSKSYALEKKVSIAIGNFHPFFPKNDDAKYDGIFYQIIQQVFKVMEKQDNTTYILSYQLMPNERIEVSFKGKVVEAAANIFALPDPKACLSTGAFRYRDVAMTLKTNPKFKNSSLKSIQDLANKNYDIVAYQNSTTLLGKEYDEAVKKAKSFKEYSNQETTGALLAKGRTDIRIGDINVFLDSIKKIPGTNANDFQTHEIFKDVYASMAFWDKKMCDSFSSALEKLKKDGDYEKIYNNYLIKSGLSVK